MRASLLHRCHWKNLCSNGMYKNPPISVLPSENKVPAATLENTIEQTILAIVVHTILATVLRARTSLIPLLVAIYVIGRVTFSLAYRRSKPWRAFGMALTAAPTDACFVLAAAFIIAGRLQ